LLPAHSLSLSFQLLSENLRIKIHQTIILPLWGCLKNRVLGRIFDIRGRKWQGTGEDYIMKSFITCTLHQILLG
jgi:hypothetical protein